MGKFTAQVDDHFTLPAEVCLLHGQQQSFREAGEPIVPSARVRLIIDTGSKRTSLVPGVIHHLRPFIAGKARIETSVGAAAALLFWVRLEFPETSLRPISEMVVAGLELPPILKTFHGVVGRDLLQRWDHLHYEGRRGRLRIRDSSGGLWSWLWRS